jgi:long-chain fatty acid transport protein
MRTFYHKMSVSKHNVKRLTQALSCGLFFLIVSTSTAVATPFELYGVGSRASALGNVGTASASDYTAVHYNPAGLLSGRSSLGGGLSYAFKDLDIKLSPRPEGYDIPNLGASSPSVPSEFQLRERQGQNKSVHSFTLFTGLSSDLGTDDLRVGFLLSLPVYHSVENYPSAFSDERERLFSNHLSFNLLGGRVEHFVAQVAVAYQIFDWLALGVGSSVMPDAFTHNYIYINDAARQDEVDLNVGLQTSTQWRINAGFLVIPNDRFRVGFSYHDEQFMLIRGINEVQVRGLQGGDSYPFEQSLFIITDYSPRQFTYGLLWLGQHNILTADLVYTLWSDYLDSHGQKVDFNDTWSPRVGYEYHLIEGQELRVGLRWEPSPIPEQIGRSNFVDNNRYIVSLGTGHDIKIQGKRLNLSWHIQLHGLLGRTNTKRLTDKHDLCEVDTRSICDEVSDQTVDPTTRSPYPEAQGLQTGNLGFPAYSSGGLILQAGVEISWNF